jgi:hypothetical protein
MIRLLLTVITLTLLTACGTESKDESAPATESNVTAAAPTNTSAPETSDPAPVPPETISQTADLRASTTFEFTSSFDVVVDINLNAERKLYLNICNRFERDSSRVEVDYGSCVLQAPLRNGNYEGTLSLTNDVQQLVIAVWDYSGANPVHYFWDLAIDGPEIRIE